MNILITGGTGFIGSHLSDRLIREGHSVTVTGRSAPGDLQLPAGVRHFQADTTSPGAWQKEIGLQDGIVNLAGEPIIGRWSDEKKRRLRDSRIQTTRHLVGGLPEGKAIRLCSASAVGYYGFHGDEALTEEDGPGTDFLAVLCRDWEREALRAADRGARVLITRFGIVLGKAGGALRRMLPAFRWGLGGPLGNGRQWFSWIHIQDLVDALVFLIGRPDAEGIFNLTAPDPVTNSEFTRALGQALRRPAILPAPAFALRRILGEFGSTLLEGQRVLPERLIREGFRFRFPTIREALAEETP